MIEIQGEPYLTAGEAADFLGIKRATLYAYVSRGLLTSYRQGMRRARLYREQDLQRIQRLQPSKGLYPLPHAADWIGD